MTLLIASIAADHLADLQTNAPGAWESGADAVEIRIDAYADDPAGLAAYLKTNADRTWIVTCRSQDEGGRSPGDARERASLLATATAGTNAYLDFELANWLGDEGIRERVRNAAAGASGREHRLILSAHDFEGAPARMCRIADRLRGIPQITAGKIAYCGRDINDSFVALDVMHAHGAALTAICMGEEGIWTRLLSRKFGAFCSYGALTAEAATAPGQLTVQDMIERYRWPQIDAATRVFGVIGDPVAHSMSPFLFNRWFAEAGVNAVYLPLRVRGEEGCLARFLDGCRERSWLDLGGFSVTLPHKAAALNWVGADADRLAASIGAVNTLIFRDGAARGHNTDCHAAIDALADALGGKRGDLAEIPVDVLGAGGAARAVLAGLRYYGCPVTIYARAPQKVEAVARAFDCRLKRWEERRSRTGVVLVNCTSVGMWPETAASPMPPAALDGCRLVFDLIYNPLETRLLKDATARGAGTLNGLEMFLRQAALQFELWTSKKPGVLQVRDSITGELRKSTGRTS